MAWKWTMIPPWILSAALFSLAVLGGWIGAIVVIRVVRGLADLTGASLGQLLGARCSAPTRILGPLLGLTLIMPLLGLPPPVESLASKLLGISSIVCLTWLGTGLVDVAEAWFLNRYDVTVRDNLKARAVQTQVRIVKRIIVVILIVLAAASGLMTFEKVRELGSAILTTAGIAGIILGIAAQRTISTILAGLQIAMTQPFRIDDVLVVENEWGKVEEITLTYVVLRIWDLRRLVLPITYFLEKPFQNWTRVSSELLGAVFLYVDYTVDVQALRDELNRIAAESNMWDGKVCSLQVTNTTDRCMELRALVSATDAGKAWDLRCLVREKLIAFLKEHYPGSLPRVRAVLETEGQPWTHPRPVSKPELFP